MPSLNYFLMIKSPDVTGVFTATNNKNQIDIWQMLA